MEAKYTSVEKLKSKKLIDALFDKGKSVTAFPIRIYYLPIEDEDSIGFKTGVSVPKRNFKLAVHRNRIKRLLREAFRKNKYLVYDKATQHYALLIVFIGKQTPDYEFVEQKLQKALKKLGDTVS